MIGANYSIMVVVDNTRSYNRIFRGGEVGTCWEIAPPPPPPNKTTSLFLLCPGQLLVKEWGTDLLADPSFFCSMALVRLPDNLIGPDGPEVEKGSHGQPHYDYKHAGYIGNKLQEDYKIEVHNFQDLCH